MGGVHCVGTVDPARGDDTDGRLLLFHYMNLYAGGLGAEKDIFRNVKGVLGVPGRVVLGRLRASKL